ncbi:MAG TPA: hypothetical protein VF172_03550 [Nitrososphaera sp.]
MAIIGAAVAAGAYFVIDWWMITPEECYDIYSEQRIKIMQERGLSGLDFRNYVDSRCNVVVYSDYYNLDGSARDGMTPPQYDRERAEQIAQVHLQKTKEVLSDLLLPLPGDRSLKSNSDIN